MGADAEDITLEVRPQPATESTDDGANEEQSEEVITGIPLYLTTASMMLALLAIEMDRTILSTVVPTITSEFHSLDSVGWYGGAYLLTYCTALPILGQVYRQFRSNLRWIFVISLLVFEAGSVVCATAKSSSVFIFGRAFAGVGGAGVLVGGMSVTSTVVPLRQRSLYFAIINTMTGVAALVGPPIGGLFADSHKLTWRWCFWINLPIGFVTILIFVLVYKPRNSTDVDEKKTFLERVLDLDVPGGFVLLGGMVPLLLALQWGGSLYNWSSPKVWALLIVSTFMLMIFVIIQIRNGERAIFPPRIFRIPTVVAVAAICLLLTMGQYVHIYFLPIFFRSSQDLSAKSSGLLLLSYLLSDTFAALVTGALIAALGRYKPLFVCGVTFFVTGSILLFALHAYHDIEVWILAQIPAGAGMGVAAVIFPTALHAVLRPQDHIVANTLIVFLMTLGGVLGANVGQAVFSNALSHWLMVHVPEVDPKVVEAAGATGFRSVLAPSLIPLVQKAFEFAVSRAFIIAVATGGVAALLSLIVRDKNLKNKEKTEKSASR